MDDVDDDEGDPVLPGVVLVALVALVGGFTGVLRDSADGIPVLQERKEYGVLRNSHGRIRN
jgi:hypothetical protein